MTLVGVGGYAPSPVGYGTPGHELLSLEGKAQKDKAIEVVIFRWNDHL